MIPCSFGLVVTALVIAGQVIGGLPAQRRLALTDEELAARAALDPYTGNDLKKMKALGYVTFGPFRWNRLYSTTDVVKTLGASRIRWVETRHFKLGCALAPRALPKETRLRRLVLAELKQLKKRLPGFKSNVRTLDRWTLLHLYAQRLENVYADFAKLIDVTDADFPRLDRVGTADHYMGEGKYLGQRAKFCVILFDQQTQLLRYLQTFAGYTGTEALPVRHDFSSVGSLAFATSSECHGGMLYGEVHMHAHLVGELVKNFASGYKANLVRLPVWWTEGLGHWYSRKIDPRIILMDETTDPNQFVANAWHWDRRVRSRVKNGHSPTTAALFDEFDTTKWKVQHHMMAWSRFEFLLRKDPAGIRRFLDYLNDLDVPIRSTNGPRAREYQIEALRRGWSLSFDDFDAEWEKFVLTKYRRFP